MADTVLVQFPSGRTVSFGSPLAPAPHDPNVKAAFAASLPAQGADVLEKALGALGDVVATLDAAVEKLAKKPDSVQIAFAASLTGNADLWVVSGQAQAEFTVTLSWNGT